MKALVFEAPRQAVVADVEEPEIGPDEVLVRSHAVGICHSDFELYEGRYIIPVSYPIIPGHEWCGEVVEVGASVTGLRPDDPVVGGGPIGLLCVMAAAANNAAVTIVEPQAGRRAKGLDVGARSALDPTAA